MQATTQKIKDFIAFAGQLKGDEKGESQIFLDRLYQMNEPVDRVPLTDLANRYTALNFLFPEAKEPQFNNDLVAVTRKAAQKVADTFNLLIKPDRPKKTIPRDRAQRFILQCVVALFAEDIDLLPCHGFLNELLNDCKKPGGSSYDLLGGLFRQMASKQPADGGRFKDVRYFNGGIFNVVEPVDLTVMELTLLAEAAVENWAKIDPAIFGTLFVDSMDQKERRALGGGWQEKPKNASNSGRLIKRAMAASRHNFENSLLGRRLSRTMKEYESILVGVSSWPRVSQPFTCSKGKSPC
jgi:hypothetical protein